MKLNVIQLIGVLVLVLGLTRPTTAGVCSVSDCTNSSRCLLSKDQQSCKCVSGFYSQRCDKNAEMKVVCDKDLIRFRALEDFFVFHGVTLDSLHLPNRSCRAAERQVIGGVAYYVSTVTKEAYRRCGGKPVGRGLDSVTYSLSLRSEPVITGNIVRDPVVNVDFSCSTPLVRRVSLPYAVLHYSSEMVLHQDDVDATIQMLIYEDESYSRAYRSAPTIHLRDKVFVEVRVSDPVDFFLLRVDECWASQVPEHNATEGSVHSLVLNGCVSDDTVSFLSNGNGGNSTVRYSFSMFRFTTSPHDLYLHCTVRICTEDDHKACTPSCNSITKREAIRSDPALGLLSYGPIRIQMPDRPESSVLTTVVLPVAAVWTVGFFLIVIVTVAKAGRRRTDRTTEGTHRTTDRTTDRTDRTLQEL